MNIRDRIKKLAEYKGISMYTLSQETGISQSALSRMMNNKTERLNRKNLQILAEYFHVNLDWLVSGNGEETEDVNHEKNDKFDHEDILSRVLERMTPIKRKTGKLTEVTESYKEDKITNLSTDLIKRGQYYQGSEMDKKNNDTRPRVPYAASAGSLTSALEGIKSEQCEQIPRIWAFPDYDFTIIIKGNSMEPKYEGGDEVACKRVDNTSFIQWGKVHVLDTAQGIIIKRVYEDGDLIRCVSYNPEYPDFSVRKDEIYSMSLVVGLLRM